ncbi:MAG TPA: cytochrome D1 domain-containing protein [Longimicrobium sp.]
MRRILALLAMTLPLAGAAEAQNRPDLVIVANKQAASATVLDAASGRTVATIAVGDGPHEVAVSGDGKWAVVTNYGNQQAGSSLSVIDLDRMAVTRTIDLAPHRRPHGAVFLPGDRQVAVTSETSRAVLVVGLESGTIDRVLATGEQGSHMLVVSPDGKRIYTANIFSGSVTALDASGATPARSVPVAAQTEGIALSPDGRRIWVGSNAANTITVLDAATLAPIDTLPSPGLPYRLAVTSDGSRVVVPNPMLNAVRIFDARAMRETALVQLPPREGRAPAPGEDGGASPVGIVLSPDGRTAYVALQGRDQVGVLDVATGRVKGYFDTGAGPDGIAYAARGRRR